MMFQAILDFINPFSKPSAEKLAEQALQDAKRHLLDEQAKAEYHLKMSEYYKGIISRLSKYPSN